MTCRRCGDCCDPILLRATKREIRADRSLEGDEFILRHWRRVSKDEAFRKRPLLRASHYTGRCYYVCDRFNPTTRLCEAHDARPPICRAFPNNLRTEGRPLRLRSFPNCGYNETATGPPRSGGI
jgi:Fe-S-cluster containining protein